MSDSDYCLEKINSALSEKGLICNRAQADTLWEVKPLIDTSVPTQFFYTLKQLKDQYLLRPEKIFKHECFCLEVFDAEDQTLDLHHFKCFSEASSEKQLFEMLYGEKVEAKVFRVNDKGVFPILTPHKAALKII